MVKSTKSETSQKTETKQESTKTKKSVVEKTAEPSVDKKVKTKKTKAPVSAVENVVISSTAPVSTTVPAGSTATEQAAWTATATTTPAASSESKLSVLFTEFFDKLQKSVTALSALKSDYKVLEKYANKELKALQKSHKKKGSNSGNRSPSGFVKPTLISNELASFLGKASGSEMARTEVTREINMYIRAHSLQDKSNGRQINADDKLSALLKLKDGDVLTYFNLQKFMSPHFAKVAKAQPVSSSA